MNENGVEIKGRNITMTLPIFAGMLTTALGITAAVGIFIGTLRTDANQLKIDMIVLQSSVFVSSHNAYESCRALKQLQHEVPELRRIELDCWTIKPSGVDK